MHLPQSLSRIPESFPWGSLKVCSLFLDRAPHKGFPVYPVAACLPVPRAASSAAPTG